MLATAGVAACGTDDEPARSTTTTVDENAWLADLESDCAGLNDEFAQLARTDPSDADEAVAYAGQIDEFAEAMVAVLDDAMARTDDDDRRAELEELVAATSGLEAATTRLAEGAAAGDTAAVDEATADVTRLGAEINTLAEELGVSSCGGF